MTAAQTVSGEAVSQAQDFAADVGEFLSVFAALLLDNVLHLEETAGRVTNLVMSSGRPGRELIVTPQTFDRLKQEFEAFGDAPARYAESINALPLIGEQRAQLGREVIEGITVADLKNRLSRRLQSEPPMIEAPHISELVAAEVDVAEVDVDVVF